MKLIITETSYDYFDYDGKYTKPVYTVFEGTDAVIKAKAFYDLAKSRDYNYDDSWHKTTISRGISDYSIKAPHKEHGQRFGHKPTTTEKLHADFTRLVDLTEKAYAEYAELYIEEGFNATETNEAYEHYQTLLEEAENAWKKYNDSYNPISKDDLPFDGCEDFDFSDDLELPEDAVIDIEPESIIDDLEFDDCSNMFEKERYTLPEIISEHPDNRIWGFDGDSTIFVCDAKGNILVHYECMDCYDDDNGLYSIELASDWVGKTIDDAAEGDYDPTIRLINKKSPTDARLIAINGSAYRVTTSIYEGKTLKSQASSYHPTEEEALSTIRANKRYRDTLPKFDKQALILDRAYDIFGEEL